MTTMTPVEFFTEKFPVEVVKMKICQQGAKGGLSPYHLEGDVFTHTMMVYSHIDKHSAPLDYFHMAALLHDIGKTRTRMEVEKENGMVVARFANHEGASFLTALNIIENYAEDVYGDIHANKSAAKACLFAIANHGIFKDNPKMNDYEYGRSALSCFDKLSLAMLDGLIAADRAGRLMTAGTKFKDTNVRGIILDAGSVAPVNIQETFHKKEVVVMIGLPRSGKSTYIHDYLGDYATISRDALIMESCPDAKNYNEAWGIVDQTDIDKKLMQRAQTVFKTKNKVVIDMTNMSKKSRKKWLALAKANGFFTKAYVMPTSVMTCMLRSSLSEGKQIPSEVIVNMAKRFTFPLGDEFDFVDIKW